MMPMKLKNDLLENLYIYFTLQAVRKFQMFYIVRSNQGRIKSSYKDYNNINRK